MVAYQEIQNTLEYVEGNITEPLDIRALAEQAHLSSYYFQRLFTRLVGRPIADYQKQRRLAQTLEPLLHSEKRILDIAVSVGFNSHESFIRAFKSRFDMTPEEYRKSGRKESGMTPVLMPDVTMRYTLVDEGVPLVADGIILEITRRTYKKDRLYGGFKVFCKHGDFSLNPGVAWNYLDDKALWNMPYYQKGGHNAGLMLSGDGGFEYMAGCLVSQREEAFLSSREWQGFSNMPDYLEPCYISVPSGEYLVCTFTAEDFSTLVINAFEKAFNYFFGTFIPKHNIKTYEYVEIYDGRCEPWHPTRNKFGNEKKEVESPVPLLSQGEGPEMEIQVRIG